MSAWGQFCPVDIIFIHSRNVEVVIMMRNCEEEKGIKEVNRKKGFDDDCKNN